MRKLLTSITGALAGIMLLMATLAGCATLGNGKLDVPDNSEFLVKYATMKLIENSSDIEASDVIGHVDRLRAYVEADSIVELAQLRAEAEGLINWNRLAPSDQMLVRALFGQIEQEASDTARPGEMEARIQTLLTWVDQAADLYAN